MLWIVYNVYVVTLLRCWCWVFYAPKQALHINGYPDWVINSIPSIQPSMESTTSVLSDDTSDDGQVTERNTTTKKPTSKKPPVVLPCIKVVSEQIRRVFRQSFKLMNTLCQLLVGQKEKS